MRTLPKHLRPRWRYLGVGIETWPDARLDRRSFQGALWDAARTLLGDPGSADCDLTVTRFRFDSEGGTGEAIVRVRREEKERGRAALACVTDVDGQPIGLVVRGTSGTIRACAKRYLRGRSGSNTGTETDTTVPFSVDDRSAVRTRSGRVDVRANGGFVGVTKLDVEAGTDVDTGAGTPTDGEPEPDPAIETETPEGGE